MSGAGALGHGDRTQLETPAKLSAFGDAGDAGVRAASIGAGGFHSVVRDVDGGVWSWGRGEWGRLGHSDSVDALAPKRLEECDHLGPAACAYAAESHSACLTDGVIYTWGRNEHWQLGYECGGLLNAAHDARQDPGPVPLPDEVGGAKVTILATGETGCVALLEDDSLWYWGMARHFMPTRLPMTSGVEIGSKIVDLQMGASHVTLLSESGRLFTYGKGTPLCLPKAKRKSWELAEVTADELDGRQVVGVACGSNSTALILD